MSADLCFTIDLDRDVNIRLDETPLVAGSIDRGQGTNPRFSSALKGLECYVSLLDDIGMPCTFFCEGHTLEVIRDYAGLLDGFEVGVHGYDHEDLAAMPREDAKKAVEHGCECVKDVLGRNPTCFRAPYMNLLEDLGEFLDGTGIHIDSSSYADASQCIPFKKSDGVIEVPVAEGRDSFGKKISAYLWPLHEGKRKPIDYSYLAQLVPSDGCFVLCDHTWHIPELRSAGMLPDGDLQDNILRTRSALESIIDSGSKAVSISESVVKLL